MRERGGGEEGGGRKGHHKYSTIMIATGKHVSMCTQGG